MKGSCNFMEFPHPPTTHFTRRRSCTLFWTTHAAAQLCGLQCSQMLHGLQSSISYQQLDREKHEYSGEASNDVHMHPFLGRFTSYMMHNWKQIALIALILKNNGHPSNIFIIVKEIQSMKQTSWMWALILMNRKAVFWKHDTDTQLFSVCVYHHLSSIIRPPNMFSKYISPDRQLYTDNKLQAF